MTEEPPLPLPQSAKRYWYHLVPMLLFPSFVCLVVLVIASDAWRV